LLPASDISYIVWPVILKKVSHPWCSNFKCCRWMCFCRYADICCPFRPI